MGRAPRASTASPPSEAEHRSVHRGLTISSGTEVATEEERALLQHRLALFTRALFVLVLGTYPVGLVELRNSYGLSWSEIANHPVHIHLLFVAVVGFSWWFFAARPRRRSMLEMGDAGLTIGFCVIWVVAVMAVIFQYPEKATSAQVDTGSVSIVIALLVVVRAALVPSRIRRTAVISSLAFVPCLTLAYARAFVPPFQAPQPPFFRIFGQAALAVLTASLVSVVIYRLRRQVREATELGQYVLEEKLGEGGMGVVYRGRHALLRRQTAIKLLKPGSVGPTSVHRFEREVRLASQLTHPNTVAIYDYGRTPDGVFYYAMELLDGVDLQRLVELDGPQPPARTAYLVAQVCGALSEAHAAGLVHRDIKPANIIACIRGGASDVAKVVDFGLVKRIDRPESAGFTAANVIAGTPHYLSPEAIGSPDEVDGRSDIYALGAVMYFLLTGTPVFTDRTLVAICAHHLATVPEPPSKRADVQVPEALERIVLRCLEKRPEARYASTEELAAALAPFAAEWTQAEARAWWKNEGAELRARRGMPPSDRTLAVDLWSRGAAAAKRRSHPESVVDDG